MDWKIERIVVFDNLWLLNLNTFPLSAIHKFLVMDTTPWTTDLAAKFRHRWLAALVCHHLKAVEPSIQVRTLFHLGDLY